MSPQCEVRIEYFAPPASLRRYCSTFFLSEIFVADDQTVEDYLFPEWPSLRFSSTPSPRNAREPAVAAMRDGSTLYDARFPVVGPRTKEIRFRLGSTRIWSINLNPLGWARFVRQPAHLFANTLLDGNEHPAFAPFRPLSATLFGPEPDLEGELARITQFLLELDAPELANEQRISDIFMLMLGREVTSVTEVSSSLGISDRTLERLCLQHFGFSPKLLLRRQRFLRSLTQYMADPSLKWIGAMDALYHDQAQFVRDFREFMGMTPTEYAALDKPIMGPVMRERVEYVKLLVATVRNEQQGRS